MILGGRGGLSGDPPKQKGDEAMGKLVVTEFISLDGVYIVRVRDGLDVNVRLVAIGAAAPYFYSASRGMYATRLEALARNARASHLGLWGACPHTVYNPY